MADTLAPIKSIRKDPDDVIDVNMDWDSLNLPIGDTISTSTWSGLAGSPALVEDSESIDEDLRGTTIWMSEGVNNTNYLLVNKIVTSDGRTLSASIQIAVREK